MSTSNGKNNSSSDKAKDAPPKPGEPAPKSDEARFLAQQAADAKAAIKAAFSDIATGCGQSVSVGGWMKQYPWLTLGASTVAGFVASAVLVPSKEDQALRKLAKIERALNPPSPKKVESEDEDGDHAAGAKQYKSGRQSFMRSVMGEVIKAVQPAVVSLLTAGVTAQAAKPSQEEMQAAAAAEDQRAAGVPPTE